MFPTVQPDGSTIMPRE